MALYSMVKYFEFAPHKASIMEKTRGLCGISVV